MLQTVEVEQQAGITESERYLGRLCAHSFLSLWSYQNIHTDEGRRGGKGSGQEFCDLMVVFGDDIILFSDKHIQFGSSRGLDIEWRRWFKRAVLKSARQLRGAKKWLLERPDRLYLDATCTKLFPLTLPTPDQAKIHLVAVAVGGSAACRSALGGSGSIPIRTDVRGDDANLATPFVFGLPAASEPFIHIFDEVALDSVLGELDTISDFADYLKSREELLTSGRLLLAAGEDDLLAFYMQNVDAEGNHTFPVPTGAGAVVDDGLFAHFVASDHFRRKKQADTISYCWDRLIEIFSKNIAAETLEFGSQHGINYGEKAVRIMAAESRLRRRLLGQSLIAKLEAVPLGKSSGRAVVSNTHPDIGYVFYICSPDDNEEYGEYRKRRLYLLHAHCMVLKHKWPRVCRVVGVAMEPKGSRGGSQDLVTLDVRDWSPEQDAEAQKYQEEFSIFRSENVKLTESHHDEFPLGSSSSPTRSLRPQTLNRQQRREIQRRDRARRRK